MLPSVEPGYLLNALPENAPEEPEDWQEVLKDFNQSIMPGVSTGTKVLRLLPIYLLRYFSVLPSGYAQFVSTLISRAHSISLVATLI